VVRNANGREVPVSRVEDVVVSDSGGVKTIERTVRRFDANGNPGPPEKARIETRKEADGTEHTVTTVRRADINGNLQVAERQTQIERKGSQESSTVVTVERPTANGSFEVVERTEEQERNLGGGRSSSVSTTSQRDSNGRLAEITKRTAERTVTGDKTVENAAEYESTSTGQMRLTRQTVARSESSPSGSGRTEMDIFEQPAGRAAGSDAKPQLVRRQLIEKEARRDGITEKISVSFASPNDPNRLGELRQVEQTVCTGDCGQK
jgi:hypothetical protein